MGNLEAAGIEAADLQPLQADGVGVYESGDGLGTTFDTKDCVAKAVRDALQQGLSAAELHAIVEVEALRQSQEAAR